MRLTGCASWWLARTCSGGVTGLGHPLRARRYPGLEAVAAAHPRAGPGHRPGRAVLTKSVIYAPGAATIEPHGSSAGAMTRVWPGTSPAHPAAGSPSRTFEAPCARADRSRRRSCTPWTPSVAPSRPGIWTQPCACSPPTTTSPSRRPRRARPRRAGGAPSVLRRALRPSGRVLVGMDPSVCGDCSARPAGSTEPSCGHAAGATYRIPTAPGRTSVRTSVLRGSNPVGIWECPRQGTDQILATGHRLGPG